MNAAPSTNERLIALRPLVPQLRALLISTNAVIVQRVMDIYSFIFSTRNYGVFAATDSENKTLSALQFIETLFFELIATESFANLQTALKLLSVPLNNDSAELEWVCRMHGLLVEALTAPPAPLWRPVSELHQRSKARTNTAVISMCADLVATTHIELLLGLPWLEYVAKYLNELRMLSRPSIAAERTMVAALLLITDILRQSPSSWRGGATVSALAMSVCMLLQCTCDISSSQRVLLPACKAFEASRALILNDGSYKDTFITTLKSLCVHVNTAVQWEALLMITSAINDSLLSPSDFTNAAFDIHELMDNLLSSNDAALRCQSLRLLVVLAAVDEYNIIDFYQARIVGLLDDYSYVYYPLIIIFQINRSMVRREAVLALCNDRLSKRPIFPISLVHLHPSFARTNLF